MDDDLSEVLAQQARQLFAHLPPGEVHEDEPVRFRTDADGHLMVYVLRTGCTYILRDRLAWRWRSTDDGAEITCYQNGDECQTVTVRM